jgi:hypothetical protein
METLRVGGRCPVAYADRVADSASITVRLSEFAVMALVGEERGRESVLAALERAVWLYLNDSDTARPGWRYPLFLRDKVTGVTEFQLKLEPDLREALEDEAERQEVSLSQLATHAVLYYAAELNAGRLTERILDSTGEDDDEGDAR